MNRWACRRHAAAMCRHRSPDGAGTRRHAAPPLRSPPARRSVTNVGRSVARTAFFHAGRRPTAPALPAGDLPKGSGRLPIGGIRATCARKFTRSATNLCVLTIVNEALGDNPNIRLQVGANHTSIGMHSQDRGRSSARQAAATSAGAGRAAADLLIGVALAAVRRRRQPGSGRRDSRGARASKTFGSPVTATSPAW